MGQNISTCWSGTHRLPVLTCVQDLMRGISQRSTITAQNWTMYLAERLKQRWRMSREFWPPPFYPRRGREAMEYSVLPLVDRCVGQLRHPSTHCHDMVLHTHV